MYPFWLWLRQVRLYGDCFMTIDSIALHLKKLEAERAQILQELMRLREALKSEVDIEIAEADPELVEQKITMTLIQEQKRKLKEVDYALQQMQRGKYGVCESCGKPINPERLEIVPETTFCTQCKMMVEQKMYRSKIIATRRHFDDSSEMAQ